jgi:hypothetical protein
VEQTKKDHGVLVVKNGTSLAIEGLTQHTKAIVPNETMLETLSKLAQEGWHVVGDYQIHLNREKSEG